MKAQEIADRAEAAAITRFLAMRKAFQPCWGVKAKPRVAIRRHRPRAYVR